MELYKKKIKQKMKILFGKMVCLLLLVFFSDFLSFLSVYLRLITEPQHCIDTINGKTKESRGKMKYETKISCE